MAFSAMTTGFLFSNFSISPTGLYVEVGSDVTRFKEREPGYQQFLGNGYLVISTATTLSSNPDDWTTSPPLPFTIRDGKAVIDLQDDDPGSGSSSLPPAGFFKVSILPYYQSSIPVGPVLEP